MRIRKRQACGLRFAGIRSLVGSSRFPGKYGIFLCLIWKGSFVCARCSPKTPCRFCRNSLFKSPFKSLPDRQSRNIYIYKTREGISSLLEVTYYNHSGRYYINCSQHQMMVHWVIAHRQTPSGDEKTHPRPSGLQKWANSRATCLHIYKL